MTRQILPTPLISQCGCIGQDLCSSYGIYPHPLPPKSASLPSFRGAAELRISGTAHQIQQQTSPATEMELQGESFVSTSTALTQDREVSGHSPGGKWPRLRYHQGYASPEPLLGLEVALCPPQGLSSAMLTPETSVRPSLCHCTRVPSMPSPL